MRRYVLKAMLILSFAFICQFPVHVFSKEPSETPAASAGILSLVSRDNQQMALKAPHPQSPAHLPGLGDQPAKKSTKLHQEEEQNMMEEALALLDESEKYWKQGDLEYALELLDQAYSLIIETDSDPAIARQKDDLRLLISRRILAVYSSRQTVTIGKHSEIPLIMNADVEKEIRSFQTVEREFFISSYRRSGLYRTMIVRELKKAGLPEELSWLPLVESGFKVSALSKARALGPWQFIPSTGYKYGLNRDEWIDERMDPEKSTRGAIGYLKDLHDMFGDWLTVLAAYNCGEGRVLRVISSQQINYLDRFWDLYYKLPYETARYVPRFLATLHIVRNPEKFGMDLGQPLDSMIPHTVVETNKIMRLSDIAAALEISEDTINSLNPELRHRMTPDRPYALKVPQEMKDKFTKVVESIQSYEQPRQVRLAKKAASKKHKVKRGETVASIAQHYGISVNALMAGNGLGGGKKIFVGQRLNIPQTQTVLVKSSKAAKAQATREDGRSEDVVRYKVKKGDTLVSIAQRYGTSTDEIRKLNNIKGDALKIDQVIKVSKGVDVPVQRSSKETAAKQAAKTTAQNPGKAVYTVQKGDSLQKIARENNVSLSSIRKMNNLEKGDNIHPGQVIIVR